MLLWPLKCCLASFLQHPFAERNNEPCLFGNWYEIGGRDRALHGMDPSDQGFTAAHLPSFDIETGLVMKNELSRFKGRS